MRNIFLGFFLLSIIATTAQNVQSPKEFLGYEVGTTFTRHHKIVDYFKAVAASKPNMVKLEKYGQTNENRELLLTYISSPENIKNLEAIRNNNLATVGVNKGISANTKNAPAIVWLSYNVHGNEPSSSEAAMLTLFALVDDNNVQTKEWLKNTIVIIDPCLNPDGRDRYVNWYNSMVGTQFNANPQTREHQEPWPQGRSNHYNFDLNRDWAWQTQVESQQRAVKYLQWMPHVHVDFHEQGYNQPYYFAPAAEPFHEVITPWQKDFQTQIGKNHSRYFDANGWVYFSKERFDLFYPSYGDTYPTYNGAIGMTYEQGGIRAGLGVVNNDNDTLTLVDRAKHHFTTGISTIETASINAQKVVDEFKLYFDNSRAAKNFLYKTYIVTANSLDKITTLERLLKANGIEYGMVANTNGIKGFNYATQKEEVATLKKYHIAVSMLQPRSTLATVLLEPKGNLSDSNTYDITAWALPYAFGADAYAIKEALSVSVKQAAKTTNTIAVSNYGYVIKYTDFEAVKVLANLLKQGIKIKVASKPFTINGENFDRGSLIVLNKSNASNLHTILAESIANTTVKAYTVASGFVDKGADFGSPDVNNLVMPKIAVLTGEQTSSLAAGEVWNFFDKQINYPVSLFNAADVQRLNLKEYNTLIIPDGNYKAIGDKNIVEKLKEFVKTGGKIIALENAVQQMAGADWGIKIKEDKTDDKDKKEDKNDLKKYADRERENLSNAIPGAIYKVEMDSTHPLAYTLGSTYYSLKQDDNLFQYLKDGWNVGIIKKDSYVAGFAGVKVKAKLKDGLLFGVQEMGNGNIVYLSDNPLFRLFWENGKMLFSNAVFMVGQ